MLTVGGLAATTLAQQDNRLILASGQEVPIGSLGQAVNVRGCVLPFAAFEHLHYLKKKETVQEMREDKDTIIEKWSYISMLSHMLRMRHTFSEYIEGALMGLMTTMFGPAWV